MRACSLEPRAHSRSTPAAQPRSCAAHAAVQHVALALAAVVCACVCAHVCLRGMCAQRAMSRQHATNVSPASASNLCLFRFRVWLLIFEFPSLQGLAILTSPDSARPGVATFHRVGFAPGIRGTSPACAVQVRAQHDLVLRGRRRPHGPRASPLCRPRVEDPPPDPTPLAHHACCAKYAQPSACYVAHPARSARWPCTGACLGFARAVNEHACKQSFSPLPARVTPCTERPPLLSLGFSKLERPLQGT